MVSEVKVGSKSRKIKVESEGKRVGGELGRKSGK